LAFVRLLLKPNIAILIGFITIFLKFIPVRILKLEFLAVVYNIPLEQGISNDCIIDLYIGEVLCRVDNIKVKKNFSVTSAAQQVLGKAPTTLFGLKIHEDFEDKETIERRQDCQKRLLMMKARNADAAEDRDAAARAIIPQEDLQEWLDELQLRLNQACVVSNNASSQQGTSFRSRASRNRARLSSITTAVGKLSSGSSQGEDSASPTQKQSNATSRSVNLS